MKRKLLTIGFRYAFLFFALLGVSGCQQDEVQVPKDEASGSGISLRLLALPNTIKEVDFFLFQVPTFGTDTLLLRQVSITSQVASQLPLKVGAPLGNYVVVAVANAHSYLTATPQTTKLSDLMIELTQAGSVYNSAPECFWGINRQVQIGINTQAIIPMKRLVGKMVVEYIHGDPTISYVGLYINGVPLSANYQGMYAGNVQMGTPYMPVTNSSSFTDSLFSFPTQGPTYLTLKLFWTSHKIDYVATIDSLIRPNRILYVTINGGTESALNISSAPWTGDTTNVLLDESPEANITNGIEGYQPQPNDTLNLRAVNFAVTVNGGIPANYTGSFVFTLKKTNPVGGTLNKNVPMKVVNGQLMTKTPIYLSHGTYQVSGYLLADADGTLPDPNGKSVPVTFQANLNQPVVQLTLDGRQAVENAYLIRFCNSLHGTGQTDGSIWPGTVLYAKNPIPSTFPTASSGIVNSPWYTSVDNMVQLQPIRGEWRVYSICYRGFTSPLNGVLSADFCNFLYLTSINIRNNNLTGTIPTAISGLTRLNTLSLGNNQFTGTIDALANNTQITYLLLNNNNFSGSVATGLAGSMPVLVYLAINNNQFSGTLATVNVNISYLYCQSNKFSGQLPAFANLLNLVTSQIDVRYNSFSCYPSSISAAAVSARVNPQGTTTTPTNINPC